MWNFPRIICIWICCVSCMFGTTQLSSLVRAVPYEYFDDHEQNFYDLDAEQIQAKYDARLLSQQLLQTQQQQQQQQYLDNLKGLHNPVNGGDGKPNAAAASYIPTSKNTDGHMLDLNDDDDDADERSEWLEETLIKPSVTTPTTTTTTTAMTETLDELYLPRAASCFTNGQKFTHGQKVPRLDNCEVCLCMDGEIFCWWEKCDKKPTKAATTYDDYATAFEESSTIHMQLKPKTTYKTTLKPMWKTKTNEDYKYDDDDSAEIREMKAEYEGIKEQLMRNEQEPEQHKIYHNNQMAKKKMYQQQLQGEEEKHKKKFKKQNNIKKKQEDEQKQSRKQHKTTEQHRHGHNHNYNNNNSNNNKNNRNNRNNNHDYGSIGSSSKILNFPENLPSVLYYDYKTEEHHQHQHQHHVQHLKHQKQKQQQQKLLLQQHEKQLMHQQQHKLQKQQHHVNRNRKYDEEDVFSYKLKKALRDGKTKGGLAQSEAVVTGATGNTAEDETKLYSLQSGSSTPTLKYFSHGNENIYSEDLQTDSDILPEPPTNRPKISTTLTGRTAKVTRNPISQRKQHWSTSTAYTITKSTMTTNTPTKASTAFKQQIYSPWDHKNNNNNNNNENRDEIINKHYNGNANNKNNEIAEDDTTDTDDDQDDAFHRWLTSTETNNKNNFTLNDAIIGRDDDVVDVGAGGSGLDAGNNDYNVDEKNYENINWETDMQPATLKTQMKAATKPLTTTINTFDMEGGGGVAAPGGAIYYENIQKPKYEQNFNENIAYNNTNSNNNNLNNSNEIINSDSSRNNNNNHNRNPAFNSNPKQNVNRNNNKQDKATSNSSREGVTSSPSSNEDNAVVAGVVNIDIMLTASSADLQKQQQQQEQQPLETNTVTSNQQHRQWQLHNIENEKQIIKTQQKFRQPQVLISNTNDADNNNPLYSIINDNTSSYDANSNININSNNNKNENRTSIVDDGLNIKESTQLQNVGVNLSSGNSNDTNSFNKNSASSQALESSSDSFKFNHITAIVSQTNATSADATPPSHSTTSSPERQCNVMGTLYKIGDVLPQDTGNCLQCICIDGSTSDDTPRVTCSPHNCPPLVLPDLFDATGY